MPFEQSSPIGGFVGGPDVQAVEQPETPSFFSETIPSAFRLENVVGSTAANESGSIRRGDAGLSGFVPVDPDFDPWADIAGTHYEPYWERFAGAENQAISDALKSDIDRENKDRDVIARSGALGIGASMAAGVLDIPTLLPGGAIVRNAGGGVNLLRTFGETAAAGAAAATFSEFGLQSSQQLRTGSESATVIGGATILSGVLGATFGKIFSRAEQEALGRSIERDFIIPPDGSPDPFVPGSLKLSLSEAEGAGGAELPGLPGGASLGAERTARAEDVLKSALGAEKAFRFEDPGLRTLGSSSAVTRRYAQELFETPFTFTKSRAGEETAPIGSELGAPGAVETRIKTWQAPLSDSIQEIDNAFFRYRKGRGKRFSGELSALTLKDAAFGTQALTYRQFKAEISSALRNGDVHNLQEVAEAAKAIRRRALDPLKNEAIAAKLLPEDVGVETAPSYLNRLYSRQKIVAERDQFKAVVRDWLAGEENVNSGVRARVSPLVSEKRDLEAAIRKAEKQIAGRAATAERVEARQAEAARLNFFAYKRAVKLSEPVDELRTSLDEFSRRIRTGLDDVLDEVRIGRENALDAGTRADIEHEADQISEALADIHYQADLGEAIAAGARIDASIAAIDGMFRDIVGRRYLNAKAAGASPEIKAIRALEAERAALGRRLRPYRQELDRLRKLELSRATKPQRYSGPPLEPDEIDTVVGFWQYARELYARPTPQRLSSFVVAQGGVEDPGGDVLAIIGTYRSRPGLIRRGPADMGPGLGLVQDNVGRANALDAMALRAWEAGFFPELTRRPTINEFLDKLAEDLQTGTVVRGDDVSYFEDFAVAQQMEEELADYGVTIGQFRKEETLRSFLGQDFKSKATQDAGAARPPGEKADQAAIQAELERRLPRAREGAVFETEIRGRSNLLADQASGKRAAISDIESDLARRRARLNAVNKALEDEVNAYRGKTAKSAQAAIVRRDLAEAARTAEQRTAKPRLGQADKEVLRAARSIAKQVEKEPGEIDDIADQIIDRIISTPDGRLPYDAHMDSRVSYGASMQARGPLSARVFMIPDRLIEPWLENDIEELLRAYVHTMAPDIELTKRFGSVDMTLQMKEIQEDYARKSAAATTAAERVKINRQRNADIRDLAAVRDRLRGVYKLPDNPDGLMVRTGRVLGSWNYLRLLGGMTLSALPDISRPIMAHGYLRTFGDGIVPLFRNWRGAKLAMKEVKAAGTALDMVLDSRAMRIADVRDDFGRYTKFERGVKSASRNFGVVSLMAPWNAAMKQFVGLVTQTRMLQAVEAVADGTIKPKELEYLAAGGISRSNALKIAEQFAKHGRKERGVWFANTAQWDAGSRPAIEAFRSLLVRDVDRIIVTPGAADRPLWMSSELGRLVGQFRSFSLSSMQKVLISGLQQRDMAFLNGSMLAVALGGLVHIVKARGGGYDPNVPQGDEWGMNQKTAQFMVNAVDRSGLTGWLMDANNMTEKLTRGAVGLSAVTGKPVSRYASRNITASLLGPSVGTVEDAIRVTGSVVNRDWSQGDSKVMKRLIPYANLFYLRRIFDNAQEGIDAYFGVPKRKTAR